MPYQEGDPDLIAEWEEHIADLQAELDAALAAQQQAEAELRDVDLTLIGLIAQAGIPTPQEGYRKAGWGWLERDLKELVKSKQQAEARAAALAGAVEAQMKWIGPPPTDAGSFDSLREDAWQKSTAALAASPAAVAAASVLRAAEELRGEGDEPHETEVFHKLMNRLYLRVDALRAARRVKE